jgi:hypothetical protein
VIRFRKQSDSAPADAKPERPSIDPWSEGRNWSPQSGCHSRPTAPGTMPGVSPRESNRRPPDSQAGSIRLPNRSIPSEHYVALSEIVVNLAQLARQIHAVAQDWPKDPEARVGRSVYKLVLPLVGEPSPSRRCDNATDVKQAAEVGAGGADATGDARDGRSPSALRRGPAAERRTRPQACARTANHDYFANWPGSIPLPSCQEAPTAPTTAVRRSRPACARSR